MTRYDAQIGAVFYLLWGLLHLVAGASLLAAVGSDGASAVLAQLATAAPESVPPGLGGAVAGTVAFHMWNLAWMGLFAVLVAALMNWRNSRAGYWLNLGVVSAADLGLIVFLVLPGYMRPTDAIAGPALWLLAALFSTTAQLGRREAATTAAPVRV
jgi:hypothetical protein